MSGVAENPRSEARRIGVDNEPCSRKMDAPGKRDDCTDIFSSSFRIRLSEVNRQVGHTHAFLRIFRDGRVSWKQLDF